MALQLLTIISRSHWHRTYAQTKAIHFYAKPKTNKILSGLPKQDNETGDIRNGDF